MHCGYLWDVNCTRRRPKSSKRQEIGGCVEEVLVLVLVALFRRTFVRHTRHSRNRQLRLHAAQAESRLFCAWGEDDKAHRTAISKEAMVMVVIAKQGSGNCQCERVNGRRGGPTYERDAWWQPDPLCTACLVRPLPLFLVKPLAVCFSTSAFDSDHLVHTLQPRV